MKLAFKIILFSSFFFLLFIIFSNKGSVKAQSCSGCRSASYPKSDCTFNINTFSWECTTPRTESGCFNCSSFGGGCAAEIILDDGCALSGGNCVETGTTSFPEWCAVAPTPTTAPGSTPGPTSGPGLPCGAACGGNSECLTNVCLGGFCSGCSGCSCDENQFEPFTGGVFLDQSRIDGVDGTVQSIGRTGSSTNVVRIEGKYSCNQCSGRNDFTYPNNTNYSLTLIKSTGSSPAYSIYCISPAGWRCGNNPVNSSWNGGPWSDINFWARPDITCSINSGQTSGSAGSTFTYTANCGGSGAGTTRLWYRQVGVPGLNPFGSGVGTITGTTPALSAGTYQIFVDSVGGLSGGQCTGFPDAWFNGGIADNQGWIDCNPVNNALFGDWLTLTVTAACDITVPGEPPSPPLPLYGVGDSQLITVTTLSGTIESVSFSPGSNVSVSPAFDGVNTPPYQTTVTSTGIGPGTYTAIATASGGLGTCTASGNVNVDNPVAWWRVIGGDAIAGGRTTYLESIIPSTASIPYFIQNSAGGFSGVPSAGTTLNFAPGFASLANWRAGNSPYLSTEPYGYSYFENKIPGGASPPQAVPGPNVSGTVFESGGTVYPAVGSYYWYIYNGSGPADVLTIERPPGLPPVNVIKLLGRRVILFVKNASVRINTPITVTKGLGGMYIISDGDIDITPTVGGGSPDIEAILFADGTIRTGTTGTGDIPLHIRGSVVGWTNIDLQRDLPDNSNNPGELIEFAPDMLLNWPPYLTSKNITWREVAP